MEWYSKTGAEVVEDLYNDSCENNPKENGIYLCKGSALHVFRSKSKQNLSHT